ncbi:MAG: PAS domain S-box protein, partial [Methanomicrobia archaeon]|nr:PAS domain S-box protein [Methanomicrobia archaeon]
FCTYANHRMEEMLGYESLVGKHWEEIIVPEEIDRMVKETKTRAHGRESSYETVLLTNSGEKIPVIVSATPLFEEGKFVGTMGVFVDIREQKRVEESRKESEKLYKSLSEFNKNLLENSPIGIMNINKEMKVEYENPEMRRILGLPFGRELSATWRNIQEVPFVEETGISSIFDELRKGKEIFKEISFTFPEGERGYLTLKGVPILEDSKFAGAVLLVNDITGLKGAEEKLRESEEKYRLISEGTSDMIAMTTFALNPVYTYVSSSIKRIMGYEPEDMIGKSGLDFIHPDNKKKLLPLLRKYITAKAKKLLTGKDSEISEIIEYRAIDKLGKWHYLQSTVNLVGNQMLFVSRDITEEKKMEETLRKSEERFRILFERIPEATVYTDENIRIIGVNPKFEELFGYSRDEIIGRNLNDLVIPEDKMEEAKRLDKKSIKGGYASSDTVRKRKDGSLIPVSISGGPIIIGSSKIGMVTVYKDITEQKKAEEVLHQRAVQADLINKVGQRVGSELELKILLSEIVNSVRDTFDYYGVMLLLRSEDTDYLILQSITGGYSDIFLEDLSIKIGEGVIGYAAKIGKTQISGDVTKNPYYVRKADEITKSELSIPIRSKQKEVIGVLDIQSDEFDAFSDADVIAMETLSTQIAAAIENARLYEQAQKDIREREKTEEELQESKEKIEQLHKIAAQMESVQSEDEVYQLIIDAAKRILEFSICSVSIVDGDRLEIKATSYEEIPKDRYMAIDEGVMGRTYRTGKSYLIDDIKKDKDAKPTEEKFRSALSVPIWNIGVFLGIADEFNAFTQNDLEMTELLISHATEALKRIQSEKALREERDRAQKYLDVAGVLMVVLDADQKVTLINKKGCEMLGYKEEEIIGKNWTDNFTPEEIKDEVKIVYEKLFTGEVEPVKYNENPILTKSGEERIVAWHNSVLKDETGNIVGILSSGEDITERKKAEEELRESERELSTIFNSTKDGIVLLNKTGKIIKINKRITEVGGYTEKDIVGKRFSAFKFFTLKSLSKTAIAFTKIMADVEVPPFEVELKTKEGKKLYLETYVYPVKKNEKIVGIVSILRNITERKKAEESLRESEEKFRTLTENINIGIYRNTVGPEGKFIEANSAIIQMFGYSDKEEFLNVNVSGLYQHPEDREKFSQKMLKDGFVRNEELQLKKKDGTLFYGSVSAVAVKDETGKVKYYDGMIEDITEQKKAEEALKRSEEKYKSLIKQLPIGVYRTTEEGKILHANPTLASILEYESVDELMKSYAINVYIDPAIREKQLKEWRSKKGVTSNEIELRTKTGRQIWVRDTGRVILDENGEISYVDGTIENVTEWKKAEQIQLVLYKIANTVNITKDLNELFRSIHNTLGTIIDTKNFYIALYDKEKELLSFPYYIDENYPEREATTVTSRKSVKGLTEYVIKIGKGLLVTKKEIEELAEKGEIELIGTLPLFWLGVPLKLNEKTFGVIAVQTYSSSTTCTEQDVKLLEFVSDQIAIAIRHKQADEEKEKSRKEAEFYSDVLGHDVGNINQVISGYLYLLKNAKDEETRKKNVKGIKKSIEKSKRLAESIKTLKIIKDTKIEKFDLNKSIERSIKEIKEYFDREIEVNLNIDKKYYVNANDFLDKVFFNIFENSVEYTFHDPVIIDVKTEEKDGFCSVHIHDNGLGISKEKREDILENLETLSKRTGIGFYLTKKILERFNGKFEIKDVKKGTGIVISIPVINGCSVRNVHAQRSDERNERRGRES